MIKRILVIGNSGSGKSTLAKRLSERLRLPYFASDHFFWEPGWKPASHDRVCLQVNDVLLESAWILDGNFDEEHEHVWKQADCIIWLDYPRSTILKQIVTRNLRWAITRQRSWSGNKWTMQRAISGIRHAIQSYPLKKQIYPCWLSELSGIVVYRFRTKRETEIWFQNIR
jgi:adenylate kinase family enzyme